MSDRQAIRLADLAADRAALETELYARLSNEICRILNSFRNGKQVSKLFLSHAKPDGRTAAFDLKNYIDKLPGGEVFFDEVDLRPWEKFGAEFVERIAWATLVMLLTDSWAPRYWCQWEALTGKELDRPILLVGMLSDGERRHFPYLGKFIAIQALSISTGAGKLLRRHNWKPYAISLKGYVWKHYKMQKGCRTVLVTSHEFRNSRRW